MEIRLVIDAPRGWFRRLVLFGVTPLALIGVGALWARASGVPNTFSNNQTLSASQMNANFTAVTTVTYDGGVYSVGPTLFVGATAAKTPGDMSGFTFGMGYGAAKQACQYTFQSRPTVHMCTSEELVRYAQTGGTLPASGWYSTGVFWTVNSDYVDDCTGWTSTGGTSLGSIWSPSPSYPFYALCSSDFPILCCD